MAVVPLDVDLQDPPEALPKMIAQWRAGFDVVYGVRDNRETDSLPKRITADFYYRAHNWLSNDKIPEHAGDFRLLDRRVVDVIRQMPERNRFMKGCSPSWFQAAVSTTAKSASRQDQV
jgi:glycosyltransferase involved in cell wall biosynthesis